MSKYNSISIKEAMNNIATNHYLLPAIQRKFVWESEQIEMLFDSIMRNYPINSFMFWKITDNSIKHNYTFYQFIQHFAEKFHEDNIVAPSNFLENDFNAVIDGQQRMTSLYIGLGGTYRKKKANKRWKDNEDAMPTKKLYLELSSALTTAIDNEKMYNFAFMSEDELTEDTQKNTDHFWFEVAEVLKFQKLSDVNIYILKNNLTNNEFATTTLSDLFNKINTEDLINYYVVTDQDPDKVLDVFLRTNRGGTPLSFSDLLMSIASANWTLFDAREELKKIRKEIYTYGNPNFDVSQDFILKTMLVLSDSDVRFKIANFDRKNITKFESQWDSIRESLVATFNLLSQLGFNDSLLRAKNAAIPIAYYIYKNNLAKTIVKTTYDKADKKNISKWLSMSLIKGMFGAHSDGMLKTLRDVIKDSVGNKFPLDEIINKFKGNADKNYTFTDDIIDSLLEEEYGSTVCSLTLILLYPNVVLEHGRSIAEDHMHPKTIFENKNKLSSLSLTPDQEDFYKKNYNTVLNLQLLDEATNKSKNDDPLEQWVKDNSKKHEDLYVDSTVDLNILNFEEFIKSRRSHLKNKLKALII